nr:hypothetical protein [Tanacetum cinerariifolium]
DSLGKFEGKADERYFVGYSVNAFSLPHVPMVTPIDDTGVFGNAYDDDVLEEKVDMNNVNSSYAIPKATKLVIAKDGRCFVNTSEDYNRLMLPSIKLQLLVLVNAAQVKRVNDQAQIQALVDKKKVIITKDNIRSDLHFDDAEETACLLNEAIFKGLAHMGAKTTAWNEFSSTMASAIICLADNQKFNFSKGRRQRYLHELEDEDHVPIPSSDLLPSGKRVKSPLEKDSLGAEEDASKQRRIIKDIDQDDEIVLDADTQGRKNNDEMFGVDDLSREEVVLDTTTGEHEEQIIEDVSTAESVTTVGDVVTIVGDKVSVDPTTDVTEDEITMAQALAALKSTKPKVVV